MTGPNLPVPPTLQSASKAVTATLTTALGWVTLFVTAIADGSITWDEGGELIGAATFAVATVYGVWKTRNKPKPTPLHGA